MTHRAVITHSPTFHTAQARSFAQTLAKAGRRLDELAARLARGRTRKARAGVEAEIAAIVKPRWADRVIDVTLTGQDPAELRLTWEIDQAARDQLAGEVLANGSCELTAMTGRSARSWPHTAPKQTPKTGSGR